MYKNFGALSAVNDLSFRVNEGEVLGIGGPNGAGKTTLFDLISGLTAPTAGRVNIDGRDVTGAAPHRLCQAGLARTFQLNAGFDSMTVQETVLVAAQYGTRPRLLPRLGFGPEARDSATECLATVGLENKANARVSTLPVFDRKLLMLASALVTRPRVILMDEPVGGLNPQEINLVMELVASLRDSGITIVLIEHVMRFLVRLSDRIMIMHHGSSIYDGSPEGLADDERVVEVYLGKAASGQIRDARGAEDGEGA
ncbi:MAG TPA: ABC transporter ATP-binding protein [Arenicellales bacterium]|nr:ABC transporter ATP-binding protein [Arenicellales bacterium]